MNLPGENTGRHYREMVDPLTADKRNRVTPAFGLRRKVILLDSALEKVEIKIAGDFIYFDFNSTGVALISLNNTSEDAFPALALAGVENIPFEGVYITCAAQPGLVLNMWYGYNSQFKSPTSAIATIGSITNPVTVKGPRIVSGAGVTVTDQPLLTREIGFNPGAVFNSNSTLGAGATQTVFAAAANTNGAVIHNVQIVSNAAALSTLALLAKATAPASAVDGNVVAWAVGIVAAQAFIFQQLARPRFIAAGLGLFFYATNAETAALRAVDYTLL